MVATKLYPSQQVYIAIDNEGNIFVAQMSGNFSLSVLNSEHQLIPTVMVKV